MKADTTGLEYQSPEWFEACAAIARGRREGKAVQYRDAGSEGAWDQWCPRTPPGWYERFDYRLAPVPREVWVLFHADGSVAGARHGDEPPQPPPSVGGKVVKFREVIG